MWHFCLSSILWRPVVSSGVWMCMCNCVLYVVCCIYILLVWPVYPGSGPSSPVHTSPSPHRLSVSPLSVVGPELGVVLSWGGGIGMMPHSRLDWILDRDGIQPPPPLSDEIKSLNQTLYPSYIWCLMHKITSSDGRQPQPVSQNQQKVIYTSPISPLFFLTSSHRTKVYFFQIPFSIFYDF